MLSEKCGGIEMTFLQNVAIITLVVIFEAIVVFLSIFFTCELNKPYKGSYVPTVVLVSLNFIALGIVIMAWANGFVFPLN